MKHIVSLIFSFLLCKRYILKTKLYIFFLNLLVLNKANEIFVNIRKY